MNTRSAASTSDDVQFAALPANDERGPLTIEYKWVCAHRIDAPIALFLHEGLGSVSMWRDWPQQLCARLGMRGLIYSRPGYGQSSPRPHDRKWPVDFMSHQARDVLPALLDSLAIDDEERRRTWLIGHSDGGSIALLYASAFPGMLRGAVVIAPHVFVEDISVRSIAQAKLAYEQTDLRSKLSRYHADVDSAFYGWNDIWLSPSFKAWNVVRELAAIDCPLLAVQAEDDHYGTMAQIEAIGRAVSGAQLCRLPEGGHSPHRDAAEALNDAVAAFVERFDR